MAIDSTEAGFSIGNGVVDLRFARTESGCMLESFSDRRTDATFGFLTADAPTHGMALWEAEFRDDAGYQLPLDSTDAGTFSFETEKSGDERAVKLRWEGIPLTFPEADPRGEAMVEIRVALPEGKREARWRASVETSGSEATLWRFRFPAMPDLHRVGASRRRDGLLLPEGEGVYVDDPVQADRLKLLEGHGLGHALNYPSSMWGMQFVGFDNDGVGLYLGLHDPEGRPKGMNVDADDGRLAFSVDHYPEERGTEGNDFEMTYDLVTGVYEGDWYDAAQRYREWALDEARWTDCAPLSERDDVPDWFTDICLWWAPGFAAHCGSLGMVPWYPDHVQPSFDEDGIESTVDTLERVREEFPVPTGVHWFYWYRGLTDANYPDYEPRPGFESAVQRCETDEDLHIFPHVNARFADPNSRRWADAGLESATAKHGSARVDPAPERHFENYGNDQLSAVMCPAADAWRAELESVVERLEAMGASGVYLDQVGATSPPLCLGDHDHPKGGGPFGVTAYRTFLEELTDRKTGTAFTTEGAGEPYVDRFAGYLIWYMLRGDQVPLRSTVYGEYNIGFGRDVYPIELQGDSSPFRTKIAQVFAFGGQLGWLTMPIAELLLDDDHADDAEYLANTARALYAGREHVLTGRRLRDPEPISDLPVVEVDWHRAGTHQSFDSTAVDMPAVLGSLWESTDSDKLAFAVTNWQDRARSVDWALDVGETTASKFSMRSTVTAEPEETVSVEDGTVRCSVELPPRSSDVIILRRVD